MRKRILTKYTLKNFILFFSILLLFAGCGTTIENAKTARKVSEIYPSGLSFNADTGEIKYTLPEDALVRIRIGIKDGGPLLRTLVDWEKRGKGDNIETWDFKEPNNGVFFGKRSDYLIAIFCQGLNSDVGNSRGQRKSESLKAKVVNSGSVSSDNIPEVGDTAIIRVGFDNNELGWMLESKFEVSIFLDNVFYYEDEEGVNPFNFNLDTKNMNEGEHTVTVNIIGYEGEILTASAKILVKH
ncbi:MAG: hypothetical protein HQL27_01985 [Candidatus Omnitrophica bacterium]|nr:hypothetical protein [Candidatus Omnitrophota bacterium]